MDLERPNLARVEEDYLVALGEGDSADQGDRTLWRRQRGIHIGSPHFIPLYDGSVHHRGSGSDYVKLNGEKTPLFVMPIDNTGQAMDASGAEITWQALTPDILSIDGDGL